MQFPAVNWHEGLFLQPHHFQAWDRHWSERVSLGERWQSPHSYGLLQLSINQDALAAGFLQIDSLRCKTPGGTLIDGGAGQFAERRDLRPAMALASHRIGTQTAVAPRSDEPASSLEQQTVPDRRLSMAVDVYVGVPRLQLGVKNVDSPEHRNGARYVAHCIDVPDELDAACVRPIEVRNVNARLLLDGDDLAGFDLLRIARIRPSRQGDSLFQLDRQYVPPLLECGGSDLLRIEVLSSLTDQLQHTCQKLSLQLLDSGGAVHANSPADMRRLVALQAISPAATLFKVLAYSRGVHPLTAYIELARLVGSLEVLQSKRGPDETSPYDHENLGPQFFALKRRILVALESLRQDRFWQAAFVGTEHGMQIQVDRSALSQPRRWFLGVQNHQQNVELLPHLFQPGYLDWKLGCGKNIERMFAARAAGLELQLATALPSGLPPGDQWTFFEIVNCESPAWNDVRASGLLQLRINDSMIVARDALPGSSSLQVRIGNKPVVLQLALFGVA